MKKRICLLVFCIVALLAVALPLWSRGGTPAPPPDDTEEVVLPPGTKYKEAPMLAALVARGQLPPVEQRLPDEPKVVPPVDSIGTYGGTITVFAVNQSGINDLLEPREGSNLYRVPLNGLGIEPDLAAGYEVNREENSFTIFMRKGVKWSDGNPLTSEDVRFAFEDCHMNPLVSTWGGLGVTDVEVIDEYTVKLIKSAGLGILPLQLSDWFGSEITSFYPSAYLKKWHIDYNPDADKIAADEGYDHWYEAMYAHYWWWPVKDVDLPRVDPWILKAFDTVQRQYERNPYFWRVDTEGNQLPYIDGFVSQLVDPETYQLKVTGGAADLAFQWTTLDNLSLYKSNAAAGGYEVVLYPGAMSSAFTLIPIYTQKDPVLREIYGNVKFRQAISVAINRDEMNEVLTYGLGVPGNCSPLPSTSYYEEGWREYYAQYDPALANRLLDEIGLDKKDRDGWRMRKDGQTLTLLIEYAPARVTPALELIKEYFEAVGLKTVVKMSDGTMVGQRMQAGDIFAWMHGEIWYPYSGERMAFINNWVWSDDGGHVWVWGQWLNEKQTAVKEMLGPGKPLPANWRRLETPKDKSIAWEKPEDWWIDQCELEDRWLQTDMGSPEYMEMGKQVYDFYVKRILKIGTVGQIPQVLIKKNGLMNVPPPDYINGMDLHARLIQTYQDQYYWKK